MPEVCDCGPHQRTALSRALTTDRVGDGRNTRMSALVLSGRLPSRYVDRPRQVPEVTNMPRSIKEILDQADELAKRFEDYDPGASDERPVEEYLLERAALARARSERQVADAVIAARGADASWQKIGSLLGTSAQAAQQRYGSLVDAT